MNKPPVTEKELAMIKEALRYNDHRDGFKSYAILGPGTKGSNFKKISLQKLADSLVQKGFLAATAHGFEVTEAGRKLIREIDPQHTVT